MPFEPVIYGPTIYRQLILLCSLIYLCRLTSTFLGTLMSVRPELGISTICKDPKDPYNILNMLMSIERKNKDPDKNDWPIQFRSIVVN